MSFEVKIEIEHVHVLHVLAPMIIGTGITLFSFIEHKILKGKLILVDRTLSVETAQYVKHYIYGAVKFITFFWSTIIFWINIGLILMMSQFFGSIINTLYLSMSVIFILLSGGIFYRISFYGLDLLVDTDRNLSKRILVYQIIYNIIPLVAISALLLKKAH